MHHRVSTSPIHPRKDEKVKNSRVTAEKTAMNGQPARLIG
jgi:hypothetical protein